MTIRKGLETVLNINPQIMHGSLCFSGTRIPVTIFLDNLAEGMGMEKNLAEYPTITREQVQAALRWESNALKEAAGLRRVRK